MDASSRALRVAQEHLFQRGLPHLDVDHLPVEPRQRAEHRHLPVARTLQVGVRAADANVDPAVAREQLAQRDLGALVQVTSMPSGSFSASRSDCTVPSARILPLLISARRSTRCWISARMCELRITVVPRSRSSASIL